MEPLDQNERDPDKVIQHWSKTTIINAQWVLSRRLRKPITLGWARQMIADAEDVYVKLRGEADAQGPFPSPTERDVAMYDAVFRWVDSLLGHR